MYPVIDYVRRIIRSSYTGVLKDPVYFRGRASISSCEYCNKVEAIDIYYENLSPIRDAYEFFQVNTTYMERYFYLSQDNSYNGIIAKIYASWPLNSRREEFYVYHVPDGFELFSPSLTLAMPPWRHERSDCYLNAINKLMEMNAGINSPHAIAIFQYAQQYSISMPILVLFKDDSCDDIQVPESHIRLHSLPLLVTIESVDKEELPEQYLAFERPYTIPVRASVSLTEQDEEDNNNNEFYMLYDFQSSNLWTTFEAIRPRIEGKYQGFLYYSKQSDLMPWELKKLREIQRMNDQMLFGKSL